jgi:hypothetical protein
MLGDADLTPAGRCLATNHLIATSDLPCGSDACREGALQRANVSGGAEGARFAPLRGSRRSHRRTACFCGRCRPDTGSERSRHEPSYRGVGPPLWERRLSRRRAPARQRFGGRGRGALRAPSRLAPLPQKNGVLVGRCRRDSGRALSRGKNLLAKTGASMMVHATSGLPHTGGAGSPAPPRSITQSS